MARVYYDSDADLSLLKNKTVAVIGYGNQGRAQALNMRDSGLRVIIGNIQDAYCELAQKDGFNVFSIGEAADRGDIICLLLPDEVQAEIYNLEIEKHLKPGKVLDFASGYNIYFGFVRPPDSTDVILVAPKMIGEAVRNLYLKGSGAPALIAVHNDMSGKARQLALALAKAVGCTRAGVIGSTFQEETVTDLFAEQAMAFEDLLRLGFEVLTEAGYDPATVLMELYGSGEIIEVTKAMVKYGAVEQLKLHSLTSQYGQMTRPHKVAGPALKEPMKEILRNIENGEFAKEWNQEVQRDYSTLRKLVEQARTHPMIIAEKDLRERIKTNASSL